MNFNESKLKTALRILYGEEPGLLNSQFERYKILIDRHAAKFGDVDLHFFSASGGFPTKETFCIRADGSAKIVWHAKGQISNVPSMLVHAGFLYLVTDEGIAFCRDATTGAVKWQQRLGGTFSASPVYAAGHIYTSNEAGKMFVFKADSKAFKSVAENQLGDEAFASPVICGNQLFLRVANSASGRRTETLYCIGSDE